MIAHSESPGAVRVRFVRLAVLMSGAPLIAMVQIAILPAMTELARRFSEGGVDGAFRAQLVMAVSAPTMAIGAPLSGWVAERIGKRRMFLGFALVFTLAGCGGALAPDFWTLLVTRVLLGFAAVGLATTGMVFISEIYSGSVRNRLIGLVTFIGSGGSLLILASAGTLAKIGGWRLPFVLYAAGLVVFLLALPTVVEKRRATLAAEATEDASIRNATPLFLLTVVLAFVMYMPTVQGPDALAQKGIIDPTILTVIIMMMIIGTMVTSFLFGPIRRRLGYWTIQAITFGLLGLGISGFGIASNVIVLGVFGFVAGLGSGFIQPLTQSEILAKVPPGASSRAIGVAVGCLFVPQLLNPFLVEPVRAHFGVEKAFVYVGIAALGSAALTLAWRAKERLRRAVSAG